MKILRIVTTILFVIVVILFGLFYIDTKRATDTTYPSIELESDFIEVSVDATDKELLAGVTAFDGKDGDISNKVVVESISKFDKNHECIVTYAVCDSNNHVAKTSRSMRYKNYTPPKFTMSSSLVFGLDEDVDIHGSVGAVDSIDGDISDKVVINATDFTDKTAGIYSVSLQATNSMGDIVYLDLPIFVEERSTLSPRIELKEFLVYVPKGGNVNLKSYVTGVFQQSLEVKNPEIQIVSDFNKNIPGVYTVHYHTTQKGYEGHNVLTVIVEE